MIQNVNCWDYSWSQLLRNLDTIAQLSRDVEKWEITISLDNNLHILYSGEMVYHWFQKGKLTPISRVDVTLLEPYFAIAHRYQPRAILQSYPYIIFLTTRNTFPDIKMVPSNRTAGSLLLLPLVHLNWWIIVMCIPRTKLLPEYQ